MAFVFVNTIKFIWSKFLSQLNNQTQLNRYIKLVDFINSNFKRELSIKELESVCFYSYRNINRIFQAINKESIGQYIKRLRIEKSAEYLKFSTASISEIALELGFNELSIYSKAFKNRFGTSPSSYRTQSESNHKAAINYASVDPSQFKTATFDYTIEILPKFKLLYITHIGPYDNTKAIEAKWDELLNYAFRNNLIHTNTLYFGELLDDDLITEKNKCRYNAALTIPQTTEIALKQLFKVKHLQHTKYAKFIYKGDDEGSEAFYNQIFSNWMITMDDELADEALLECYRKDTNQNQITEIYIPIL